MLVVCVWGGGEGGMGGNGWWERPGDGGALVDVHVHVHVLIRGLNTLDRHVGQFVQLDGDLYI